MDTAGTMETVKPPAIQVVEEQKPDPDRAILESLRPTLYACSSVQRIHGGLLNTTYRGSLIKPLQNGMRTVIIKHSEEKDLNFPQFTLSLTRCLAEQAVLRGVGGTPSHQVQHKQISIQVPQLYQYLPDQHTQIFEDFSQNGTLHDFLTSAATRERITVSTAVALGEALGSWLSRFHAWSKTPVDADLWNIVEQNSNGFDRNLRDFRFHKLLAIQRQCESEHLTHYAALMHAREFGRKDTVLHGDFSTRNILIQNPSAIDEEKDASLAVIDWEACCLGDYTRDLAEMVADLYMQKILYGSKVALSMIQGLIGTYPPLDEEAAHRTVAQIGENFFYWNVYAPTCTDEQESELVQLGIDLIEKGVRRDREGIKTTFFACIFRSS
ncbi:kinase-like domain-containing protein [Aspergillus pseudotamarii]|uniref:non-specific serine/threonine protein kinase n=1 Tax=Aspergillus pseudotamarii TaxID=132259 RepID=A0A5N6SW67_ASPPS|nr:kinase-like domain-containing protein [Aspergillus pseudotamarii]KAE8137364.1 kinase-like domain-containing protein [Aspergillus pseudotamarii]